MTKEDKILFIKLLALESGIELTDEEVEEILKK